MSILKKNIKLLITLFIILTFSLNLNSVYAASGVGDNEKDETSLYKSGKKLVLKAKKLEKKDKVEKAQKLYLKALVKFEKAYTKDKKNADLLNYFGYALRKTGNFEKAEAFYLKGLSIKPDHNGINEYLGELYVQTNRIDKANERLEVLKGCNCEEYEQLKAVIAGEASKY